jgi:DNA-binding response OmpR family regulator
MGAVVKNPISQLMAAEKQPFPELFMHDSTSPVRVIGLKEAQSLSRFVPVLVLMAAGSAEKTASASRGHNPLVDASHTAKLLDLLGKAVPQSKTKRNDGGDVAFGDVQVSFTSMEATRRGQPVMLTNLEFKTLQYMIQNARRVISRDELLNEVWGYNNYPCTRTVDNLILRLRQKLERDPSRPIHFRTVHGAGYKFLPAQS